MTAALVLATALLAADPPDVKAAPAEAAQQEDANKLSRQSAKKMLVTLWTMLAIVAILIMFAGTALLIHRMARRLKRLPKAKRVKYFDLVIDIEPEPPPHEPSAEERRKT
jgi:hypothetical protein